MRGLPPRHDQPAEQYPAVEGSIENASDLEPGSRVVYPNQGVCIVVGVEEKEIAGQLLELVRMAREEDGATVMVPKGKVGTIGLRRVATADQIEGVIHYLAASYDDPELDWKVRHRDNADRLIAGGVLGVAEVVKGLHSLSRIRPLPPKEREQYDNARHLLVHEIAVSLGVAPGLAEDYIDYALMPPIGVTFKLKPLPKPVAIPIRPRYRPEPAPDSHQEDDLGLGDLVLDLGAILEDESTSDLGAPAAAVPVEGRAEDAESPAEEADAAPESTEPLRSEKPARAKPLKAQAGKQKKKRREPKKRPIAKRAAVRRAPAKQRKVRKRARTK